MTICHRSHRWPKVEFDPPVPALLSEVKKEWVVNGPECRSLLCDDRVCAIIVFGAEVEPQDEVLDWIDELSDVEWQRTSVIVDCLAAVGAAARMPFPRSLGDGLFELRFTLGPTARRIAYRFTKDGRIVLLTTFRKQRNNERHEMERVRRAAAESARQHP